MPLETISDSYLTMQTELHKNPNYGVASIGYAPIVRDIIKGSGARSISDYGAGKQNLRHALNKLGVQDFQYFPYDPVFPDYGPPRSADLVCCIDVLEHIEPEYLPKVLEELGAITTALGFYSIATRPAMKVLSDGRNAHLIQKPTSWWLPRLCEYFDVHHLQAHNDGVWLIVKPRTPH